MSKSAEEPPLPPLEIVLDPVLLLFRVRVSGIAPHRYQAKKIKSPLK